MTISNYMTIGRILLIPVFVYLLLEPTFDTPVGRLWAVLLLAIASLTDFLDGYLARKRNEVTRLGTLLDPIADKLLISAALISIVQLGYAPAWMIVIILGREFAISGLRLIAATEGFQISVSHYGKFKMVAQVIAVGLLIYGPETRPIGLLMLWVVLMLSVISMVLYFYRFAQGMKVERSQPSAAKPTLKERFIRTTISMREHRLEQRKKKKVKRLMRKVRKHERRLEKARDRIRELTLGSLPRRNVKRQFFNEIKSSRNDEDQESVH